MKQIIIQADDWGYTEEATRGIEVTYEQGITTSTTVMVTMLHHAKKQEIQNRVKRLENKSGLPKPPLGFGVHLSLTHGAPLSSRWNIVEFIRPYKGSNTPDEWIGSAWSKFFLDFDKNLVKEEFTLQIERAITLFGSIDHIDTDQNIAAYEPITEVYKNLAKEYGLPIRVPASLSEKPVYGGDFSTTPEQYSQLRQEGFRIADYNSYRFFQYESEPNANFLKALKSAQYNTTEYMFHPVLTEKSSQWGGIDVAILTNEKIIAYIRENAKLISYGFI